MPTTRAISMLRAACVCVSSRYRASFTSRVMRRESDKRRPLACDGTSAANSALMRFPAAGQKTESARRAGLMLPMMPAEFNDHYPRRRHDKYAAAPICLKSWHALARRRRLAHAHTNAGGRDYTALLAPSCQRVYIYSAFRLLLYFLSLPSPFSRVISTPAR